MHRHDSARPWGDSGLDRGRTDVVSRRIHVHKDGTRARGNNRKHSCYVSVRRSDHLVARPDAVGTKRELKRVKSGADSYSLSRSDKFREILLEQADFIAQDVVTPVQHALNCRVYFLRNGFVLRLQIYERDLDSFIHFLKPRPK